MNHAPEVPLASHLAGWLLPPDDVLVPFCPDRLPPGGPW